MSSSEKFAETLRGLDRIVAKLEDLSVSLKMSRSDLEELRREAEQAGEAGRAVLRALPPAEADMEKFSSADLARILRDLFRKSNGVHARNEEQITEIRKKIDNLESRLKKLESELLRAEGPAGQAVEKRVSEEIATAVLDIAGGNGLFLITAMCLRLMGHPPSFGDADEPAAHRKVRIDPEIGPDIINKSSPGY